ncbi:unnamed protein product [Somion occarium]|uniref:Rho guanine nucleotide exchange factor scd1 n=1 Tax=Somion occarium TaxID=3059160 RepID=A0ABP1DGV2_9APHY
MSASAGRKKSIISSAGPVIEVPVANNTLLNKAASQSTSLYQQCSALRARLMRVQDFPEYFTLSSNNDASSSRRSTDPVTQLWDCFALGVPLCYLLNLLPPPINPVSVDTASFDPTNDKTRKRAIAQFAMGVRQIEGCPTFTVTDLWDRSSTDGFVKVVNIVSTVVDNIPDNLFTESPPSSPPTEFSAKDSSDSLPTELSNGAGPMDQHPGANVTKELLYTERKYVQDLETMQSYSNALSQSNTIDLDTIHLLFPNLNKLLNFQRRFLIKMESIAEFPWMERRWGSAFTEFALDGMLNVKSELPAFLIKPVQRVCKYPLLLDSLIKAVMNTEYAHLDELKQGLAAAKRITDKVNEEQRRAENRATVKNLEGRVEDWKGHHISNFGTLLLDDIFTVTKSDMDREYHVFLFEKIILCCKEYIPSANGKKVGKSNSILKKQGSPSPLNLSGPSGSKKKNTPLLLKGRIFLNNVTSAVPKINAGQYSLAVYWKGDDDLEFFTLRCRNEEQLRLWEHSLVRLIADVTARRTSDRTAQYRAAIPTQLPNSTSPAPAARQVPFQYGAPSERALNERTMSMFSQATSYSAPPSSHPGPRSARYTTLSHSSHASQNYDEQSLASSASTGQFHQGPQGYPPHNGFDVDPEDDYEDYPPASSVPQSGRGTPVGSRKSNGLGMDSYHYQRQSHGVSPIAISALSTTPTQTPLSGRPSISRASGISEASFGPGVPQRPNALRSQFSSTRLRGDFRQDVRSSGPSPQPGAAHPTPARSRSASQPSAYVPRQVPPPLPTTPWAERSQGSHPDSRRGSGSSQSTVPDSSDYSPHSGSPITPYGSSESSLAGAHGRSSQQQHHFDKVVTSAAEQLSLSAPVKVKVHFHEDIFVIQVPSSTEYDELVERVGKKIRLCGPRRDDGPLRVKYRDEDGDLVSLGSTEDVQMAFESFQGKQVTLFVQ